MGGDAPIGDRQCHPVRHQPQLVRPGPVRRKFTKARAVLMQVVNADNAGLRVAGLRVIIILRCVKQPPVRREGRVPIEVPARRRTDLGKRRKIIAGQDMEIPPGSPRGSRQQPAISTCRDGMRPPRHIGLRQHPAARVYQCQRKVARLPPQPADEAARRIICCQRAQGQKLRCQQHRTRRRQKVPPVSHHQAN